MEYWVICPADGRRKSIDECEKCPDFEGIVVRDTRAWMKELPNCDMVSCRHGLIPIRYEGLRDKCSYCPVRDDCPVYRELESKK